MRIHRGHVCLSVQVESVKNFTDTLCRFVEGVWCGCGVGVVTCEHVQLCELVIMSSPRDLFRPLPLRVNLWHQHFLHSEPIFLGEVIISLASFDPSSLRTHTAWYDLGSRPESLRSASSRPDHGSLRVRVTLSQDCIYPLRQYETLKTMLLDSLEVPVGVAWVM